MEPVRSIYASDPDMLEIVREFALELPERAEELERLLADGRLEDVGVIAHQLKGAGGGYGYAEVTCAAGKLERAIHDGLAAGEIERCAAEVCEVLRAVVAPEPA